MAEKTKEQLENELAIKDAIEAHRKDSDGRYAMKLVEKAVWGILAAGFLFLCGYYFKQIQNNKTAPNNLQTASEMQKLP